jgi:hypothetical protein
LIMLRGLAADCGDVIHALRQRDGQSLQVAIAAHGAEASSLYWQCVGAFSGSNPYDYVLDGRAWAAYDAEQQGNIGRDWFIGGMSTTEAAYRYIVNNIRRADPFYVPSTGTRSIGRYPGALY